MRFLSITRLVASALLLGSVASAPAATYRLLVVYTPAAESAILSYSGHHSSALVDYITDYAVDMTNVIYVNSPAGGLAMPRVELAGIVRANHTESISMESNLMALRAGSGAFSHIPGLRDLYAADIVLLVTGNPNHSGAILVPEGAQGPVGEDYAYALSNWSRMRVAYTATHEFGHIFGCAHNEGAPGSVPFPYSHAFIHMLPDGSWRGDVMALLTNPTQGRQPWFSNPNLTYLGVPRGNHQTANCTRVHHERRHAVASFRTPMQYPILWNKTVGAHHYAGVVGDHVFLLSGVNFASGAEGSIRATNTIQIFGGVKVEPGATLSLRVEGPGSLSRPAVGDVASEAHESVEPSTLAQVTLQVVPGSEGVALHYGLPEGARVSYRVLNLRGQVVASRTLGARTAGRHVEMLRLDAARGSVYFVELRAGNLVRTERFALVR